MIAETRSIDPAAVTILNVDDNEAARYAKTRILRGAGYRVLEAGNGGDAWRLARESKPELVLLDVRLPDLDGLEVCRRIKADPSTSSMMVLLDSAVRVKREDKMAGLDGGADGYLVEPVEPGELLATVQALVRLRESEQRLHLALQATRDAVWEWDIESNTQTWSQAGTDLFGWTDVHRQHNAVAWWLDRVHPEDRQRISDTFNAVLFDPAASYWEGEYRFQKADGDYASVLDRCSIVRDEQGTALRMLGTLRDVTDLKKIEEELLARTFQWKQLYELANAVNRAGALSDLFEKALDAILLSLRADRASILLFDEGGTMRFAAWRGLSEAYRSAVEGHSPWNMDATDAAPIVIDDVTASTIDSALKETVLGEGIRALGFIPLSYGGRVIGKFMVYFDRPHRMTPEHLDVAQAIAGTLATGVERKRAERKLQDSEMELAAELTDTQLLQAVGAEMLNERNAQALYDLIVDAALAIMQSEFASMQVFYPERGELLLLSHRGFSPESAAAWKWVRPDTGCACGEALRIGRRTIAEDIETSGFTVKTETLHHYRTMGIRAVQSTPLVSRTGKLVGMLSTHWRRPHRPPERCLRSLDLLARQAADLIERNQAEAALRESEDRFRTLAQTVPSFLFETDAAGSNIWVSDGWCRFTGQSQERVRGHGWADALHPDDRAANVERWIACMSSGEPFESRQRLRRADGGYAWVVAKALPVRDDRGTVRRWVGSVTDIDGIVRTDEELRSYAEELTRFNRLAVDRELRMIELKKQVNELCAELGRPAPYRIASESEMDAAETGS